LIKTEGGGRGGSGGGSGRRTGDPVIGFGDLLGLASSVLLGSAIPFLPTGELVSGSAALVSDSWLSVLLIFVVSWVCSLLGDTLLLVEVRLLRGRLEAWLDRRKFGGRVRRAQEALTKNAFGAVMTGRLVPGGRAPVIMALGLSPFSVRQFVKIDLVACAAWSAVYSVIGALGGSLVSNPVWAMVIAIAAAVSLSVVLQRLRPWLPGGNRRPGTRLTGSEA
jgi:membrane protein DedA with SNARE-associated domain